jgi:hypothetical protein
MRPAARIAKMIAPAAMPAFTAVARPCAGVDVALAVEVWMMLVEDDAVEDDAVVDRVLAFADFDAQGRVANSHGSTQPY